MADLIGAVRLPQGAMHDRAGTEVVVDVLFLRGAMRGPRQTAPHGMDSPRLCAGEGGEAALPINRYFLDHPEMVLGEHARTTSPYGPVYTCRPVVATVEALAGLLTLALDRLPRDVFRPIVAPTSKDAARTPIRSAPPLKARRSRRAATSFTSGELAQIVDGAPLPVVVRNGKRGEGIPAKHARIIRGLIPIRDAVRDVLRAQERRALGQGANPPAHGLRELRPQFRPDQPHHDQRDHRRPTARPAKPSAVRTCSRSSTTPIAGWSPRSRITTSRAARRRQGPIFSERVHPSPEPSRSSRRPPTRSP